MQIAPLPSHKKSVGHLCRRAEVHWLEDDAKVTGVWESSRDCAFWPSRTQGAKYARAELATPPGARAADVGGAAKRRQARALRTPLATAVTSRATMREVEEGIKGSMWLDPKTVEVVVEDGVVRVRGGVDRRSDVEILGRLTLSVEGVIGVESSVKFRFDDRHVAPPREQRFEGG
jgi:BON domain